MEQSREQAFDQIVRTHLSWVHASARRRVGSAATAEDVTQAVFVLLWKRLPQLTSGIRLSGWLYQAVRYCSANALRLEQIRRGHEREAAMLKQTTGEDVQWGELSEELETALDNLAARDRDAILIRFFRGLSMADAGREMGISEDAARMRIQRALEKLRSVLQQRGIANSSAALSSLILANAAPDAPAHLAAAIAASAGSAGTGAVSAIAAGGARALWVVKAKVAAALVLGASVAVGTGAAVAGSAGTPTAAATMPATANTATADNSSVFSRVYDLADLVVPPTTKGVAEVSLQQLQDQIVAGAEPDTWGDAGPGSIHAAGGTSLVISNTAKAHHEIERLLDAIRASRNIQVTVETRYVTLSSKVIPPGIYDPATKQVRGGYLNDGQVNTLVGLSGSLVTAPRVTVFDGGEASVEVSTPRRYRGITATTRPDGSQAYTPTQEETWDGLKMKIGAKTTPDRKRVRLSFHSSLQRILGMDEQETKPTGAGDKPIRFEVPQRGTIEIATNPIIPDRATAILGGQVVQGSNEELGKVESVLLILVKPTVIIAKTTPQQTFPLLPK